MTFYTELNGTWSLEAKSNQNDNKKSQSQQQATTLTTTTTTMVDRHTRAKRLANLDAKSILSLNGSAAVPIVHVIAGYHRRLVIPCGQQGLQTTTNTQDQIDGSNRLLNSRKSLSSNRNVVIGGGAAAMSNNNSGSMVSLLVFHKDSQLDTPIFVADARNSAGSLRDSRQVISLEMLKNRAHVDQNQQQQPVLIIEDPNSEDSGLYTCTLEFVADPTRTHQVRVQVISKSNLHISAYT